MTMKPIVTFSFCQNLNWQSSMMIEQQLTSFNFMFCTLLSPALGPLSANPLENFWNSLNKKLVFKSYSIVPNFVAKFSALQKLRFYCPTLPKIPVIIDGTNLKLLSVQGE